MALTSTTVRVIIVIFGLRRWTFLFMSLCRSRSTLFGYAPWLPSLATMAVELVAPFPLRTMAMAIRCALAQLLPSERGCSSSDTTGSDKSKLSDCSSCRRSSRAAIRFPLRGWRPEGFARLAAGATLGGILGGCGAPWSSERSVYAGTRLRFRGFSLDGTGLARSCWRAWGGGSTREAE